MANYRVHYITYVDVQAESATEAIEIAEEIDSRELLYNLEQLDVEKTN